jgi:dolichol-phosphate mannosyltransferase
MSGGYSKNTPVSRYLGIRLIHAPISSLASGRIFTDTTNGFRGFSTKFLNDADISIFRDIFDSYELVAYLPIAAGKLGYSTVEVPVSRIYPEKGAIPTKIVGLRAQLDVLLILLKAAFGLYGSKNVQKRHPE